MEDEKDMSGIIAFGKIIKKLTESHNAFIAEAKKEIHERAANK